MFKSLETATPADWQVIESAENVAAEKRWTCGNVLRLIELALTAPNNLGWPISYGEHCLQAATRAYRANADDETIFCALLHDATEAIDAHNHGASAAELVKPFVSANKYWMVQNHALFQNYHCKTNPNRFSEERARFAAHPAYDQTVEFCREYDQNSFDRSYASLSLADFSPLVSDIITA